MSKIIQGLVTLTSIIRSSRKNNYSLSGKFNICMILLSIYLKGIFNRKSTTITQNIFGFSITAYDSFTLGYLFKEIFINEEYKFTSNSKEPKIIDCGANIGLSTFYFKMLFPNCSIMAFEPNPYAFELLTKNVEQNKLKNVELFNYALSNTEGKLDFFLNQNKGSLEGSLIKKRGGQNILSVSIKPLSSFILNHKINFIKIDVEGSERQVIEDLANNKLIENVDQFIIEFHHQMEGESAYLSEFLNHFEKSNYGYNLSSKYQNVDTFQDILIHAYKGHIM
ncbi:MAG: FkbM family methyltransferase [Reichenbachiella sp.]